MARQAPPRVGAPDPGFWRLFDAVGDAVVVADAGTGRIVLWNPAATRIFGYPREEALEMRVERLVPAELKRRHAEGLARYAQTGHGPYVASQAPLRLPAVTRDGARITVEMTLSPIDGPDAGGEQLVLAILRDITDRVRDEEALRAQRDLLAAHSEASADGILALSEGDAPASCNGRFLQMWGLPDGAVAEGSGRAVLEALAAKAEDPDGFLRLVGRDDPEVGEVPLADGRTFEVYRAPVGDGGGRVYYFRDATVRKRAERRLRRAEARYRNLVERMSAVTYIQEIGVPDPVSYMSPQIEALTGYTPEECGDPELRWRMVHPEDRARMQAEDRTTAEPGEAVVTEYRVVRRDGGTAWVRNEAVIVEEPDGARYWQGFMLDITASKGVEEALQRSEKYFRSLVQNSSDVITVTSADGTIRYVSPAIESVLGYAPEERVGRSAFELVHPEDLARVREEYEELLRSALRPLRLEARMRHRDGSWRQIEAVLSNRLDEPSVEGLVINWRDATERERAQLALRRSEERYRLVALATDEVIWDSDMVRDRQTWDGAFEETFGYPRDLVTDEAWWTERVHPDDRGRVLERVEALLGGTGEHWAEEYRFLRADGEYATVVDRATVVRNAEGRPVRMLGSMMDVTEQRAAEREVRRLNESLERQVEERTSELEEALERARATEERLSMSMTRFRSLVRNASDTITILDADGRVVYSTTGANARSGYRPQMALGTNALDYVHPEDLARAREMFEGVLQAPGATASGELRCRRADGAWRDLDLVYTNLLHDVSVGGVVVNVRDITDRKRAQMRLWTQHAVTRALENRTSFGEVADEVLGILCQGLRWDAGSVFFRHRRRGKLRCYRTYHADSAPNYEAVTWGGTFDGARGLVGGVWARGEPVWIPEIAEDEAFARRAAAAEDGLRSLVVVPIQSQGAVVGVMEFLAREHRQPEAETLEMMVAVGGQIGQFIERRRAEEELRESEERLRATFEQAAVGVASCALDGRYIAVNQKLCEMLGYRRSELIGMPYENLTFASETEVDEQLTRQLFAGERSTYIREKPFLRRDGSVIWTNHAVSLVRDSSGRPLEFFGVIQDVTERRRVEEARRQSDALYRAVVEQAAENIFVVDAETKRIVEANPALMESLGYTESEVKELTLYDIVDHDRRSVDRNVGRILSRGEGYTIGDRRYRRKDGSRVDVEVNAGPITYRGRQALCVVAHDVTTRKVAENNFRHSLGVLLSLYEAGQVLTSSLDLEEIAPNLLDIMRRVGNLSAAVIYLHDGSGEMRVRYARGPGEVWNPASEAPAAREARAAALSSGSPVPFEPAAPDGEQGAPESGARALCLPLRVLDRPVGVLEVYGAESLKERATVEVLTNLASQAGSVLENARLYTELTTRERRLEELVGKLISTQEEERRRVSYEVHDGLAQVAASAHQRLQAYAWRHPPQTEGAREDLDRVLGLVRRTVGEARKVIADLRPTVLDDFGLAAAINQKVDELNEEGWHVACEQRLGDERLPVAVETALYRVTQEALTNARKHAQTDGASLKLYRQDGVVTLRIEDRGRGFDPAEKGAAGPGERVGLSGMRERISMIGGEIEVSSEPGTGTTITVRVPVPSGVAANRPAPEP